jgi:hypothetical protein
MVDNIKQDSNFLDKPLWFSNPVQKNEVYSWNNGKGYTYKAFYKVPTSFDALVLLYLLKKSQKNKEYKHVIFLTEYEILKACGYSTTGKNLYERVRESLEIWKAINIKFEGNFYNGYGYSWATFGILDSAVYQKDKKKYRIRFSPEWLQTIQDSRFFQLVNFEYYKALKRPVSRRLFEILIKSFEASNNWSIKLANLGKKLTLTPNKIQNKIFASEVIKAIKPAIREINRISSNKELLQKANIKLDQAFFLDYKIYGEKQERVIEFTKREIKNIPKEANQELEQLLKLPKKKGKRTEEAIRKYYFQESSEYVKRNIEYANRQASKQYSAFLCKALKNDWAIDYQEQNPRDQAVQKYEAMTDQERKELESQALTGKFGQVLQMSIEIHDQEQVKNILILHIIDSEKERN